MDRFFRARVFLMFAMLSAVFGLLAFLTSTRSIAEAAAAPVTRMGDGMPADHLIGTSLDPMDTMGAGAETPNGTSSLAFVSAAARIK